MYTLTSSPNQVLREDGALVPFDPMNADYQNYLAWRDKGNAPGPYIVPPPSAQEIIAQYTAAVQLRLDTFFQSRGYDGILSAATYATSSVLKFQAEGQYAVEARDATWAKCYEILAAVEGGTSPMPTEAELLAELPALGWPQ
jgi:hypothetical protein